MKPFGNAIAWAFASGAGYKEISFVSIILSIASKSTKLASSRDIAVDWTALFPPYKTPVSNMAKATNGQQ